MINFEWSLDKNQSNILKHNISFEYAIEIFLSDYINIPDDRKDYGEVRMQSIGKTKTDDSVLLVVNTIRKENIRIISARRASSRERQIYYEKIGLLK
jgi:uncharacterized DUF497 family protein